jgi:Predicted protease
MTCYGSAGLYVNGYGYPGYAYGYGFGGYGYAPYLGSGPGAYGAGYAPFSGYGAWGTPYGIYGAYGYPGYYGSPYTYAYPPGLAESALIYGSSYRLGTFGAYGLGACDNIYGLGGFSNCYNNVNGLASVDLTTLTLSGNSFKIKTRRPSYTYGYLNVNNGVNANYYGLNNRGYRRALNSLNIAYNGSPLNNLNINQNGSCNNYPEEYYTDYDYVEPYVDYDDTGLYGAEYANIVDDAVESSNTNELYLNASNKLRQLENHDRLNLRRQLRMNENALQRVAGYEARQIGFRRQRAEQNLRGRLGLLRNRRTNNGIGRDRFNRINRFDRFSDFDILGRSDRQDRREERRERRRERRNSNIFRRIEDPERYEFLNRLRDRVGDRNRRNFTSDDDSSSRDFDKLRCNRLNRIRDRLDCDRFESRDRDRRRDNLCDLKCHVNCRHEFPRCDPGCRHDFMKQNFANLDPNLIHVLKKKECEDRYYESNEKKRRKRRSNKNYQDSTDSDYEYISY